MIRTFCGLTQWQWQQWQYDRRMAYQRVRPPSWRAQHEEYFIKHTSEAARAHLLKVSEDT